MSMMNDELANVRQACPLKAVLHLYSGIPRLTVRNCRLIDRPDQKPFLTGLPVTDAYDELTFHLSNPSSSHYAL